MSRTPVMSIGGFLLLLAMTAAACGGSDDGAVDTTAGSDPDTEIAGRDPLDCPDDSRMATMIEPPPGTFAGFATPEEAVLAATRTLSIRGEPVLLDGDRWIIEDQAGNAVAVVTVGPWADDHWIAQELTAC